MAQQTPRDHPYEGFRQAQGYFSPQYPSGIHPAAPQTMQRSPPPSSPPHTVEQRSASSEQWSRDLTSEKEQLSQQGSPSARFTTPPPPLEHHPAYQAPLADDTVELRPLRSGFPKSQPHSAPGSASPGPVPVKEDPERLARDPEPLAITVTPDANPLGDPRSPTFPTAAVTNPAAMHDGAATHEPGQIAHPNQVIRGGTWGHSLCDCSDIWTCCLGVPCPCILYGKVNYRLSLKSRNQDPTNLLGYEACNVSCTTMAILCGCQCRWKAPLLSLQLQTATVR